MAKNRSGTVSRKKRREQLDAQRRQRNQRYGIIGLAALVIVAAVFFITTQGQQQLTDDFEGELAGIAYDGSPDAPVQIVEFGDFGCHACRAWHNSHAKTLLKSQYGDQIAFQFRHFPVITQNSPLAAAAGQCAHEQDAFWTYHDYIYEVTPEGALASRDLKRYAADVDLDTAAFNQCLDSGRYTNYVRQELQAARDAGARGTPTFLINGVQVPAFPPDAMTTAIDAALDG